MQLCSRDCKREVIYVILAWTFPFTVLVHRFSPGIEYEQYVQPVHQFTRTVENSTYLEVHAPVSGPKDWKDPWYCDVNCKVGTPCEYRDEVDFRIIVMTFNRANSVKNCLESISKLDLVGLKVSVDIWIDSSSKEGEEIDVKTLNIANNFTASWSAGRACVHKRERNAYIDGQWIDTWRPKSGTKEIGLILEDDVDVAPQAVRWLKAVHSQYDGVSDVAGYSLQMQGTRFFAGDKGRLRGPDEDNVLLYGVLGTWGFSPRAEAWRGFQDWFHSKNDSLKPYVEGIIPNRWYKKFEKRGRERSMWEMWHIYYSHINKQYTVYCNLHFKMNRKDILLSSNRLEKGLHFKGNDGPSLVRWDVLMKDWNDEYGKFPEKEVRYMYDGNVV